MNQKGSISILVLVFGIVFSISIGALALFGAVQYQATRRNEALLQSLNLAEAGINYYRWHLAHDPTDFTDGTGETGEYMHAVNDALTPGFFDLTIEPPASGSAFTTITSTGYTTEYPDVKRSITVQFGPRSLASYAFLHDANVWFGQGTTVYGDVFSNGGIRMDGTNTGTVKSEKATYTCGVETGCYPDTEEKPGIWGKGGPTELWEFPATRVDFDTINADFSTYKQAAKDSGLYVDYSNAQGYHLVFSSNGSFTLSKVTATDYKKGYSDEEGCIKLYQIITSEQSLGTYQITERPIIFLEDTVWIEGVIPGKTTVVAARFPLDNYNQNIWINNNITYTEKDGTTSLGLIAQKDIIIPLSVPQTLEIDAALMAHKGRVIRHHYRKTNSPHCSSYNEATRNELIIYGSVISKQRSYWNFSAPGTNSPSSGFVKRTITYDSHLMYQPPPYFPTGSSVDIISWNEDTPN